MVVEAATTTAPPVLLIVKIPEFFAAVSVYTSELTAPFESTVTEVHPLAVAEIFKLPSIVKAGDEEPVTVPPAFTVIPPTSVHVPAYVSVPLTLTMADPVADDGDVPSAIVVEAATVTPPPETFMTHVPEFFAAVSV